ncbi:hypothetical protein C8R43DRAFT_971828 [Mycena crocata]|nr:hypothetical protein C8R43DRAFT_971828 [Mycena crocata]
MDNAPPPAYSKEYKRPMVVSVNIPPALSLDNPDGRNRSKEVQGRGPLGPRPLPPRPMGETSSLKAGTVSPLQVHKKSQSTAIPSVERPWKPPSRDGGPPSVDTRWDHAAPNPPQFRHGESKFVPLPSSHHKQLGRAPVAFQPTGPAPNNGRPRLPPNQTPQVPVDPNSFYNPAVSGHLSRSSVPQHVRGVYSMGRTQHPRPNPPASGPHVRWA